MYVRELLELELLDGFDTELLLLELELLDGFEVELELLELFEVLDDEL